MKFFSWRSAILEAELAANTKLVLLVLSTYMDDHGTGCFPSMETIALKSGLSKRTVVTHIALAIESGFISAKKHGYAGQRWARNEYRIAFPELKRGAAASPPQSEKGGEAAAPRQKKVVQMATEGGANGDTKAVHQLHSNSPVNSPDNSPGVGGAIPGASATPPLPPQQNPNGTFAMFLDWQPSGHFAELVRFARIPADYPWQEHLPEFVLYRLGVREQLSQGSWEHRFIQTLKRNAEYRAQRGNEPTPLPTDWRPSPECMAALLRRGITQRFLDDTLFEFATFWREQGSCQRSWNAKFIQHVNFQWANQPQPQADAFDRLTDRSWAVGLVPAIAHNPETPE